MVAKLQCCDLRGLEISRASNLALLAAAAQCSKLQDEQAESRSAAKALRGPSLCRGSASNGREARSNLLRLHYCTTPLRNRVCIPSCVRDDMAPKLYAQIAVRRHTCILPQNSNRLRRSCPQKTWKLTNRACLHVLEQGNWQQRLSAEGQGRGELPVRIGRSRKSQHLRSIRRIAGFQPHSLGFCTW